MSALTYEISEMRVVNWSIFCFELRAKIWLTSCRYFTSSTPFFGEWVPRLELFFIYIEIIIIIIEVNEGNPLESKNA